AKGIEDLTGKTVGVVDEEMNHHFVEVLTHEYDLARAKVRFKNLLAADAQHALQSNQVGALLVVVPMAEKYVSLVRSFFPRTPSGNRDWSRSNRPRQLRNLRRPTKPMTCPRVVCGPP